MTYLFCRGPSVPCPTPPPPAPPVPAAGLDLFSNLLSSLSARQAELSPQQVAGALWSSLQFGSQLRGLKQLPNMAMQHYAARHAEYGVVDTICLLWALPHFHKALPGERGGGWGEQGWGGIALRSSDCTKGSPAAGCNSLLALTTHRCCLLSLPTPPLLPVGLQMSTCWVR